MVNIRDHLVGLIQSTTTSSGHRDREELIDVTDIEEDLDEEDEDEDEDDDDDDDDGTDAADDDDDDEDDIDIDDDDLDLDELERMHTATEAIPFSYCHRSIANHHRNDDVDNELFSPGDETMDCCGAGGTGQPTTLMMPSYQRLNGAAASTAVPSTPAHIAEPASQRIRRYAQLSGRMLFLCCASFALLITFAVYMEQLSASNALLRALQAAATAAVQQQRRLGLLRQTIDVASGGGDEDGGSVFVDNDDDGNNDEDEVDYAYDESVVVPVRLNGLGSLCFVNGVVFYGLCVAAAVAAWLGQWWRRDGIQLLRFPLPPNRLISVASVAGIAGAGIFICSYQRVVCHLQDPLKGFCLAFGIVFYFLCCKKVMGLQKIFAAMTAVVGLLIAVDYGLCDSFRCRGVDVPIAEAAKVGGAQQSMTPLPTTGWQSRAVWTMGYIVALALWSLQWALLEAEVVTTFQTTPQTTHKTGHHLLATVSRLVEQDRHADNMANVASMKTAKCRNQLNAKNRKPKAILVAAWLHGLASLATLTTGLVDIVPATGPPSSINQFIYDTFETLMCHGNLCRHYHHHHHNDAHSIGNIPTMTDVWLKAEDHHNHNKTANRKQLNRKRRSMDFATTTTTTTSKRLVDGRLYELVINGTVHLVAVTDRHHHSVGGPPTVAGMSVGNKSTSSGNSSSSSSSIASTRSSAPLNSNSSPTSSTTMTPRKINSERYWKRYKERYVKRKKIATPSSTSSSFDMPSSADESPLPLPARNGTTKGRQQQQLPVDVHHQQHAAGSDATTYNAIDAETVSDFTLNWPIMRMALLFSLVYAVFLVCTVQFLLDTESAVFTVAVQSLALPLAGLFWSTFELTITAEHIATIIWAPEITGELICSVLGTPIVVLGLCLFGAAHMEDVTLKQRTHDAVTS